jgi:hypothetical protein
MAKAADIDVANSDNPQKDADEIDSETLQEMRRQCRRQGRDIADRWSASDEGPSDVSKLSLEHGFGEFELETSVFEECQDRIEEIDRSLAMLENRRMAAIRFLGEYRETFARKVQAVSDKLIENGAPNPQDEDCGQPRSSAVTWPSFDSMSALVDLDRLTHLWRVAEITTAGLHRADRASPPTP